MPTNIETVEISGDYESISSFSAFKKLLRNIFTTPAPMFAFLDANNISKGNFDSGYISGNRVYVSIVAGASYLFEINNDSYTDITNVPFVPQEPPAIEVPSTGRLITKISPVSTNVSLTSATNYIVTDPIESPIIEDETLSSLGIYSDRPALLSVIQHAYSEDLFDLVKEYRLSKIQECKSKIDGLDSKIRIKLQEEYSEEIQKVNDLIAYSNDYLDIKDRLRQKKKKLFRRKKQLRDLDEIIEKLSQKNELIKLEDGAILTTLNPQVEPSAIEAWILQQGNANPPGIEVPIVALSQLDALLEIPAVNENDDTNTVGDKISRIDTILSYFDLTKIYNYYYTDPAKILSEYAVKYEALEVITDIGLTTWTAGVLQGVKGFLTFLEYVDNQGLFVQAGFPNFGSLQLDVDEIFENNNGDGPGHVAKIAVLEKLEGLVKERRQNLVKILEILELELELPSTDRKNLEENIQSLEEEIQFLEKVVIDLDITGYTGVEEIFELSGFDLPRFTSFLSEQELITIQRQKQMYLPNSAIGFLPKKELQVYNEAQWYLLRRFAEFLSNLDNPRLITFGIPSNAEEEFGDLIAAEIRIEPEDPAPAGTTVKFEGPMFLYSKDAFLVMKDDFTTQKVDDLFNVTNLTFTKFRKRLYDKLGDFFSRHFMRKTGPKTRPAASSFVPGTVLTAFRNNIIDFYDGNGEEPPLSTDNTGYITTYKKLPNHANLTGHQPFSQKAIFVNHGIDFLTKELQRVYAGINLDEDSFPLDDESQNFIISSTAIESIESLAPDGFDGNIPLPETYSEPVLSSQLVSPEYSLRKICSDKIFSRTFSTFVDEQMFPVTTRTPSLYQHQASGLFGTAPKWQRVLDVSKIKYKSGAESGQNKFVFFKVKNSSNNKRTGNLKVIIYHNGSNGVGVP